MYIPILDHSDRVISFEEQKHETSILELPPEILLKIFELLPKENVISAVCTCKTFYNTCKLSKKITVILLKQRFQSSKNALEILICKELPFGSNSDLKYTMAGLLESEFYRKEKLCDESSSLKEIEVAQQRINYGEVLCENFIQAEKNETRNFMFYTCGVATCCYCGLCPFIICGVAIYEYMRSIKFP